ncbi:DDB1- and CUL4-associated factor 13 [Phytophthora cactorum]|uniref:DDB1- and CUL4-associated factor 13 n=1 Tax=Phytophthora cactorum TaxID=29920 RepID=A0A329SRB1_9STRA|nr:DDB1- and CUL4-associated factor 13 [Phytophthora cactorum]KAG2838462.1 DDB1- and CUL4-associated factor 13 [Phytophthora cactorum]KAG2840117.1 DDB1- and CUL4-associated factor 13 [Phytophthora cactorum]KAG2865171.1 DDB1- and CUL4-associated factor 13 [Phytophthora cactorum]KAG2935541.1 DDB1- and CUL4-associated factor 13 [Phytophthora cactorum]
MKVKTISRVEKDFTQEVQSDKLKVFRNYDPALHPFERPREYTRALNAVKLERLFAKPFVGALDGHCDGVTALATNPKSLVAFVSGAADGEVRVWDLPRRKCVWNVYGHRGFVRGLAVTPDGNTFYSCSEDKTVKQWALRVKEEDEDVPTALATFTSKEPFLGIDHHWSQNMFATCGSKVQVWDPSRSTPTHEFAWGADSINSVHFNPAEASLLASTGSDRNITLYDIRVASSMRKIVMEMRSNALAWNPMEPMNFTVANEDHNLYTFDMRKMDRAMMVHKDHVSAVMDVAYSPTGREFVSGSYDRTIRIFNVRSAKSREVYHTQRMQRIFSVKFSADSNFLLSGSDDTNIRIWKAEASKKLSKVAPRERRKIEYNESLKERYQHLREISRIAKHRHVPKAIKKAAEAKRETRAREQKKMANRRAHAKEGAVPHTNIREKVVVKEME